MNGEYKSGTSIVVVVVIMIIMLSMANISTTKIEANYASSYPWPTSIVASPEYSRQHVRVRSSCRG